MSPTDNHVTDNYLGLAAHVIAVERHGIGPDWAIRADAAPVGVWRVCTRCQRVDVGDAGEVDLARFIATERERGIAHIDRARWMARRALGLPTSTATVRQRPKCAGCGTRPADRHAPYSTYCNEARVERLLSQADR